MATEAPAVINPRRSRGQAVAQARYQRRLATAGDDPGALFMAHVDRIRALKDALLTLAAAGLLADLVEQASQPQAKFTTREIDGHSDVNRTPDLHEHPETRENPPSNSPHRPPVKTRPRRPR